MINLVRCVLSEDGLEVAREPNPSLILGVSYGREVAPYASALIFHTCKSC